MFVPNDILPDLGNLDFMITEMINVDSSQVNIKDDCVADSFLLAQVEGQVLPDYDHI